MQNRWLSTGLVAILISLSTPGRVLGQEPANRDKRYKPPEVVAQVDPQYTGEALKAKVEGTVLLALTIGVDGTPQNIRVERKLCPALDRQAMDALRQWRFKPGERKGKPVPYPARVEMTFALP